MSCTPEFIRLPEETPYAAHFGAALAVSGDRLFVGAPYARGDGHAETAGAVYAYLRDGSGGWTLVCKIAVRLPNGSRFGGALAATETHLAVGAPGDETGGVRGSVRVYAIDALQRKPSPEPVAVYRGASDDDRRRFGFSVALDDTTLLIGSGNSDEAWRADLGRPDAEPTPLRPPEGFAESEFGDSVAVQGELLVVSAPDWKRPDGDDVIDRVGAVVVYHRGQGTRTRIAIEPDRPERFGDALAFDAGRLVVGAPEARPAEESIGTRAAYGKAAIFGVTGADGGRLCIENQGEHAAWDADPPLPSLATACAVRGDEVVLGARLTDDGRGAAILLRHDGNGSWCRIATYGATALGPKANLGGAVAIGEHDVFVGASGYAVDGEENVGIVLRYPRP